MKTQKLEPMIKRGRAAELLDLHTRTLVRYERRGILTPIYLNCRTVVYKQSQVQLLLSGQAVAS